MSETRSGMLEPLRRVHRGHALVRGLYFAKDDARARRAILARLSAGDTVARLFGGLVVRLARSERTALDMLEALPLVEEGAVLSSSPLSSAERARAQETPGGIAIFREGVLRVGAPEAHVDPAAWIEARAFVLEEPGSLGRAPTPLEGPPSARPVREALGVPQGSRESEALIRALRAPGALEGSPGAPPRASSLVAWLAGVARAAMERAAASAGGLARALSRLARGGRAAALGSGDARPPPGSTATRPPPRPGLLDRVGAWWRERARRLAWRAFGGWLARQHAEHLRKLLALLEANDLDEALRHAIPLSEETSARDDLRAAPSLSPPSPRTELAISATRAKSGGALGVGSALYRHLRERYRALFRRLTELERWKDAAFVLAELLDDAAGAVTLLEKHRLYREAAELAEGRELPAPIVVRQWVLARDLARAVALARRHDAFAPAVGHLREKEPEAARALALAWADHAAASGDPLGALAALEAGDALGSARGLAARWAERGAEVGGVYGAEALVRWLALDGGAAARAGPRLEKVLRDPSLEGRHVRRAVFHALLQCEASGAQVIADAARLAWRAAVRDRALFGEPSLSELSRLEAAARDATLEADRPVIVPVTRAALSTLDAPCVLSPAARGAFEVTDAVLLPDSRLLVALGESGLRVLTREGRTVARFEEPADEIVLSDEGTRALVLSRRGSLTVVHRMDTTARRLGDRFELLGLRAHARTFSGERWAVALEGAGQVIDVTADRPRALFRVKDAEVVAIDRGATGFVSFVTRAQSGLERLRFEERGLVLRERRTLPERFENGLYVLEPGPLHLAEVQGDGYGYRVIEGFDAHHERERHGLPLGDLAVAQDWCALVVGHEGSAVTDVVVLDRGALQERLVVTMAPDRGPPGTSVRARLFERRGEPAALVVCDSLGRVMAIELEAGRVIADVAVR